MRGEGMRGEGMRGAESRECKGYDRGARVGR